MIFSIALIDGEKQNKRDTPGVSIVEHAPW